MDLYYMTMSKKKTQKNKIKHDGICIFDSNDNGVTGFVRFKKYIGKIKIEYEIMGLSDGEHGFHIHEYGDLSEGCKKACSHFNPTGEVHGGRDSKHRHIGDLGNIISENNVAKGSFYDQHISLDYKSKYCIIGRSVIVHEDRDDLGEGGDEESLKTGNAGKRLACGVIGITKRC